MDVYDVGQLPRTVDHDLRCVKCGYNLRTLEVTGRCPECGQPVRATLDGPPPRRPAGLRVALGLILAVAGPVMAFAIFFNVDSERQRVGGEQGRLYARLALTAPGWGFLLEVAALALAIHTIGWRRLRSFFQMILVLFTIGLSLVLATILGAMAIPGCLLALSDYRG